MKVAHATRSVRNLALAAAVLGARVSVRNAAVALVEMDKLRLRLRDEAVEAVWAGFVQIATDHGPGEIRGLRDALIATHGHQGDFQRRADQLKHGVSLSQPLDDDGMADYRLRLDPEGKEVQEAMLGPLSVPNLPRTAQTYAPPTSDAMIIPVVLGGDSEVLDVGRAKRLFTPGLLRALWLRDRGCTIPGCSAPPHWADAHHLVHWIDAGVTSLLNGALLCGRHHSIVHLKGWTATATASEVTWHR